MGNAASKYTAYAKLARELPVTQQMEYNDDWIKEDRGMKVFLNEKDRDQFIYAILAVATNNGTLDLSGADYKLFYSRRPDRASSTTEIDHLFATIAALQEGKIIAKIEASQGGKEQRDAFLALRREVEMKLDRILRDIPSASSDTAGSSSALPLDMPPAYQSPGVDVMGRKEKA